MPARKYSSKRKGTKVSRKKIFLPIIAGLILLGGLIFVLNRKSVLRLPFLPDNKPLAPPTAVSESINYNPPTQQEKTETEVFKKNLGDTVPPVTPKPTPGAPKSSVTPIMTTWSATPNVEVRGYVPGINEDGGTCTLTLTKGGQTVTASGAATPDATTVSCGLITINWGKLSPGAWSATLSYSSPHYEGGSNSNTINVE